MIKLIIRIILSAVLIFGIYKETGICTTIFASLITLYIELSYNKDKLLKILSKK